MSAGGRGRAGTAEACATPGDDGAVGFEGGEGVSIRINLRVTGIGGCTGTAVACFAPGGDGAVWFEGGEGIFIRIYFGITDIDGAPEPPEDASPQALIEPSGLRAAKA